MAFNSTILLKMYALYQIPNAWDIGGHCTPCITNLVFNLGKDSIIIQKSTSGVTNILPTTNVGGSNCNQSMHKCDFYDHFLKNDLYF